jgi:hypothetical protein
MSMFSRIETAITVTKSIIKGWSSVSPDTVPDLRTAPFTRSLGLPSPEIRRFWSGMTSQRRYLVGLTLCSVLLCLPCGEGLGQVNGPKQAGIATAKTQHRQDSAGSCA